MGQLASRSDSRSLRSATAFRLMACVIDGRKDASDVGCPDGNMDEVNLGRALTPAMDIEAAFPSVSSEEGIGDMRIPVNAVDDKQSHAHSTHSGQSVIPTGRLRLELR